MSAGDAAPQTFNFKGPSYGNGYGSKGNGNGNGYSVASAIGGFWAAYQAVDAVQPLAYLSAIVQDTTLSLTGVYIADNSAIVGVGQYVGGSYGGKPGNGKRVGVKGGNGSEGGNGSKGGNGGYNNGFNGGCSGGYRRW